MRIAQLKWTPGMIVFQPGIYGLVLLHRRHGNALSIYQIVCQLMKPSEAKIIDGKGIEDAGVSYNTCKDYVRAGMEKRLADVWQINFRQPDDVLASMPDVFLATPNEEPLFYWSFQEF